MEELSTQALPLLPNFITFGSCVRGCAWLLGFSVVPCSVAAMTIDYMDCHEALCWFWLHTKNCSQISRIMLQCQWILICNDFCGATLLQLLSYLAATFTEAARFLVTALVFYQVWGKIRVCLKTGYNQNWPFDWRHCDWQIELEVINYPVCRRTYVVQISVERGIDDLQIWTLLHIDSDYLYIYLYNIRFSR